MNTAPEAPSLIIESENARVEIDRCIVGAIRANVDAEVIIKDSIVDATSQTNLAYGGTGEFGPPLRITNSTVMGRVRPAALNYPKGPELGASLARFAALGKRDRCTLSLAERVAAKRRGGGRAARRGISLRKARRLNAPHPLTPSPQGRGGR